MHTQNIIDQREPYNNKFSNLFDAKYLIDLVACNFKVLLTSSFVFAILAYLVAQLIPNYYSATTQILTDPEGSRVLESDLANQTGQAVDERVENQLHIITSWKVLSPVIEAEKLFDDPEFGGGTPWLDDRERRTKLAYDLLLKALTVSRTRDSFIVNVTIESKSPDRSASLSNKISASYLQVRTEMNAGIMRKTSGELALQLDQLKQIVEEGDRAIQNFKAANNITTVEGQTDILQQISETNTEIGNLSALIADSEAQQIELERARSNPTFLRSLPDDVLSPSIVVLRTRYLESIEEQNVLAASFSERHPTLREARTRTNALAQQLDSQVLNFIDANRSKVNKLKKQLLILQESAQRLKSTLNDEEKKMVRLRELERKYESDAVVYESFLLRTRQLSEQEVAAYENPIILTRAQAPLKKSGPKRSLIALAGAFSSGTILGVFLLLGPALTPRFLTRILQWPEDYTGIEAPPNPPASTREPLFGQSSAPFDASPDQLIRSPTSNQNTPARIRLQERLNSGRATGATRPPPEIDLDHYDHLVRHVDWFSEQGSIIIVTAASGRTELPDKLMELANEATSRGRSVLLIDADFEKAALSVTFDLLDRPGFTNLVDGQKIDDQALIEVLGFEDIFFMPIGTSEPTLGRRYIDHNSGLLRFLSDSIVDFDLILIVIGQANRAVLTYELTAMKPPTIMIATGEGKKEIASARSSLDELGLPFIHTLKMSE
ncbi:GumC family protein [Roseibium sp.]|uniref:GumC family protein n=1 Tax=Roseibium sp. TaxID=1936156 RepID=UPI003D13B9E1